MTKTFIFIALNSALLAVATSYAVAQSTVCQPAGKACAAVELPDATVTPAQRGRLFARQATIAAPARSNAEATPQAHSNTPSPHQADDKAAQTAKSAEPSKPAQPTITTAPAGSPSARQATVGRSGVKTAEKHADAVPAPASTATVEHTAAKKAAVQSLPPVEKIAQEMAEHTAAPVSKAPVIEHVAPSLSAGADDTAQQVALATSRAVQRATSYEVRGKRYTTIADPDGFVQTGRASWYGRRFHGRKTASGEPYDMNAMTAAHKKLPLGTKIRVTNNQNGKSVVVTVNDRGPFYGNRVIDLSRAAAKKLGVIHEGTANVTIRAL